jgi:multidrug efflux pump subunit AcrA (membrane-fusion protein)
MRVRILASAIGLALLAITGAEAQAPATARVETIPLEPVASDRYQVPVVFEPSRRVVVVAPADGIVRTLGVSAGASVRELAEIGQLDRAEAAARLKVAQAVVKEMQAALEATKAAPKAATTSITQAEARLEAAAARAELERLALDRCTLRAPFSGRILAVSVSQGQYLPKGGSIAELADVARLRALVPVNRSAVSPGGEIRLWVEGKAVTGKVEAVLPLSESYAVLRELAAPLAAAWVTVDNPAEEFEPGQRVASPFLPSGPLAIVPSRSIHEDGDAARGPSIQVVRNEYVTDVPVRVLGSVGPERTQLSGAFRPNDLLIVSSSVPLLAGTLIRFGGSQSGAANGAVEALAPHPGEVGDVAGITPPARNSGIAPIGAPGSALPRGTGRPSNRPAPPSRPNPAPAQPAAGGGTVPF